MENSSSIQNKIQNNLQNNPQNNPQSNPLSGMEHPHPHGRRAWALKGLRDGIPICMGYFAFSFALGIEARNVGLTAFQSFLMSTGMVASAGEFAALLLIASQAGVFEMVSTCLIVNLRYFLMSCSLSQKLSSKTHMIHRFGTAYCITDEIFGLSSAVPGYLQPFYTYAITIVSVAGWSGGTVLGVLMGNILPPAIVNALSVSLYGMFLAIIMVSPYNDAELDSMRQDNIMSGLLEILRKNLLITLFVTEAFAKYSEPSAVLVTAFPPVSLKVKTVRVL